MSRQDDWLAYVRDPTAFDPHHFEPLITDTDDPVDLDEAFGGLPNGSELIRRIRQVEEDNHFTGLYYVPKPENKLSRPDMEAMARRYGASIAQRLASLKLSDFARLVLDNPIEFIGRKEFAKRQSERSLDLSDIPIEIGDNHIDYMAVYPPYLRGLWEAVLFMTKYNEVTYYVLNGMLEYPIEFEHAYALWKGGALAEFGETQTYIIVMDE